MHHSCYDVEILPYIGTFLNAKGIPVTRKRCVPMHHSCYDVEIQSYIGTFLNIKGIVITQEDCVPLP
jgi:hypothetical protein